MSELEGRDAGSVTGRNIIHMREEFGADPREIYSKTYRNYFLRANIPQGEEWKLDLVREMLEERQEILETGGNTDCLNSFLEIISTI